MSSDVKIEIRPNGKIRLTMLRLDYWGRIKSRHQYTMTRRQFERVLHDATITVPWREAGRL